MLDIYSYSDAAQFLRDAWEEKKKSNPAFSIRAWARHLGLKGNAPLSLMLGGKRSIPKKFLPKLIESLELSQECAVYLETLIDLNRARNLEEKDFYYSKLTRLAPRRPATFRELESFKYLGNPLHTLILEMTELKDFKPDAKWIKGRLAVHATEAEIESAIDRLFSLGLLKEERGKFLKTQAHLTNRKDIADKGSQEFHKQVSHWAAQTVAEQDVAVRDFNGYSMSIQESAIPRAKELMAKFIAEFVSEIEAPPGSGEQTYHLNLQFFGLTKKGKKK